VNNLQPKNKKRVNNFTDSIKSTSSRSPWSIRSTTVSNHSAFKKTKIRSMSLDLSNNHLNS